MALFVWQNIYSVGVKRLDEQHQKLFEIANRFHEAHEKNHGHQVMGPILDELVDYTRMHFSYEEQLMRTQNYPDYHRHKEHHDKLIELIQQYKEKFARNEKNVDQQVMNFLKTWLNGHILGVDKKYRPYLQQGNKDTRRTAKEQPAPEDRAR